MNHKVDRNAKLALDQYKYEMANELGVHQNTNMIDKSGDIDIKKLAKAVKNRKKR